MNKELKLQIKAAALKNGLVCICNSYPNGERPFHYEGCAVVVVNSKTYLVKAGGKGGHNGNQMIYKNGVVVITEKWRGFKLPKKDV